MIRKCDFKIYIIENICWECGRTLHVKQKNCKMEATTAICTILHEFMSNSVLYAKLLFANYKTQATLLQEK